MCKLSINSSTRKPELEYSQYLLNVSEACSNLGVDAYLVGGFVRDRLLHRSSQDLDIAVIGDNYTLGNAIAKSIGGKVVCLDKTNKVVRVILPTNTITDYIDIVQVSEDLATNLETRDFTIDAMAIPIDKLFSSDLSSSIIDRHGGREDLDNGIIRAISSTTFMDDPVRLIRAVRLSGHLGFEFEPRTAKLIRQYAKLITTVAWERIRDELLKILAEPDAVRSLRNLDDLGLLTEIIPELGLSRGVTQPPEHHYDVFDHMIETVGQIEILLQQDNIAQTKLRNVPAFSGQKKYFAQVAGSGINRLTLLKFVGLLHDLAKPDTKTIESSGRIRFLGHDSEGAKMADKIMNRLRFSKKEIGLAHIIIRNHLRPTQMAQDNMLPSSKAIYRFYRDLGNGAIDVLYLNLADYLAAKGPLLKKTEWANHCRLINYILQRGFSDKSRPNVSRLVDGNDIMDRFGIPAGPEIGTMLELIQEARSTGEVSTKEEAFDLVSSTRTMRGNSAQVL